MVTLQGSAIATPQGRAVAEYRRVVVPRAQFICLVATRARSITEVAMACVRDAHAIITPLFISPRTKP